MSTLFHRALMLAYSFSRASSLCYITSKFVLKRSKSLSVVESLCESIVARPYFRVAASQQAYDPFPQFWLLVYV